MACTLTFILPSGTPLTLSTDLESSDFSKISIDQFDLTQLQTTDLLSGETTTYTPTDEYDLIAHLLLNKSNQELRAAIEKAYSVGTSISYLGNVEEACPTHFADQLRALYPTIKFPEKMPPIILIKGPVPGLLGYKSMPIYKYNWLGQDAFIVSEGKLKVFAEYCKARNAILDREDSKIEYSDLEKTLPDLVKENLTRNLDVKNPSRKINNLLLEIIDHKKELKRKKEEYISTLMAEIRAYKEKHKITDDSKDDEIEYIVHRKKGYTSVRKEDKTEIYHKGIEDYQRELAELNSPDYSDDYVKRRQNLISEIREKGVHDIPLTTSVSELLKHFINNESLYEKNLDPEVYNLLLATVDELISELKISEDLRAKAMYSFIKHFYRGESTFKVPLSMFKDYFLNANILTKEDFEKSSEEVEELVLDKIKELFLSKLSNLDFDPKGYVLVTKHNNHFVPAISFIEVKPLLGQTMKWNILDYVDKLNPAAHLYQLYHGSYIYSIPGKKRVTEIELIPVMETITDPVTGKTLELQKRDEKGLVFEEKSVTKEIDTVYYVVSKKLITDKTRDLKKYEDIRLAKEYIDSTFEKLDLRKVALFDMKTNHPLEDDEDSYGFRTVILPSGNYYKEGEVIDYINFELGEHHIPDSINTIEKFKIWLADTFRVEDAEEIFSYLVSNGSTNVLQKVAIWLSYESGHPNRRLIDEYEEAVKEAKDLAKLIAAAPVAYYYVISDNSPSGIAPLLQFVKGTNTPLLDFEGKYVYSEDRRLWHTRILPVTLELLVNISPGESRYLRLEPAILTLKALTKVLNDHGIKTMLTSIDDNYYKPISEGGLGLNRDVNALYVNGILYLNYEHTTALTALHEYTHMLLAILRNSNSENYSKMLAIYKEVKTNFKIEFDKYAKTYAEDIEKRARRDVATGAIMNQQELDEFILEEMFADDYSKYLLKKHNTSLDDLFKAATEHIGESTIFDEKSKGEKLSKDTLSLRVLLFDLLSSEVAVARDTTGFNIVTSNTRKAKIEEFINKNKSSVTDSKDTYIKEKCE